jgi:two-component system chemotaxis response regulator CheB
MAVVRTESKFRIIVVDDSVIDREILVAVLTDQPGVEVVAVARNGVEALDRLTKVRADALLIDLAMPSMDGIELLRRVRQQHPAISVLVVSGSDSQDEIRRVLQSGAMAVVRKPGSTAAITPQVFRRELEVGLAQLMAVSTGATAASTPGAASPVLSPNSVAAIAANDASSAAPSDARLEVMERGGLPRSRSELVVIGASTGGPDALHHFFSKLPTTYRLPTLIVQHMPPVFTTQFAKRLDAISHLEIREVQGGEPLEEGRAYLAPGGKHIVVTRRPGSPLGTVVLHDGPPENSCKPAVDPLFRSAAELYGSGLVGVVFTGMGSDGQLGCRAIQAAGGWVMVQDQPTSVVWGMPGYVARDGQANCILPLDRMAPELARIVAR